MGTVQLSSPMIWVPLISAVARRFSNSSVFLVSATGWTVRPVTIMAMMLSSMLFPDPATVAEEECTGAVGNEGRIGPVSMPDRVTDRLADRSGFAGSSGT